jgi:hypothetical protein
VVDWFSVEAETTELRLAGVVLEDSDETSTCAMFSGEKTKKNYTP